MPAVMIASSPVSATWRLERARQRQVQLGVLAREQVVVDDLAQERVAELVAPAGVGHDHVRLGGLAHDGAQLGAAQPAGVGEHVVRQDARGREQPQHLLGGLAQALDPHHQRVAQRGRQPAAAVEPRREQLLGEQRVALAARVQALDELAVGRAAEDVLEQVGELVARQARQLDPARARVALELGEQRAQRVAAVQLVGAVGRDHEHALGPQAAGEEDEEGARRAVGPVDVLEHERERLLAAEQVEQRQQRLEQARLAARRLVGAQLARRRGCAAAAELRQQRGELRAHARRAARRAPCRPRARASAGRSRSGRRAAPPRRARRTRRSRRARPRRSARRANSATMRDLPTPDSPATKAREGARPRRRPARPRAPRARPRGRSAGCSSCGSPRPEYERPMRRRGRSNVDEEIGVDGVAPSVMGSGWVPYSPVRST